MKTGCILADLHCGHVVGLTPPGWQTAEDSAASTKREKYAAAQRESWQWYAAQMRKHGPFDVVLTNGDLIDGRGEKSGGTELITSDRQEQCDMAVQSILRAMYPLSGKGKKSKLVMTYGTPYHTGKLEDWENLIARECEAVKIGSHEWIDVDGVVIDLKHHIGSSAIPHGRHTAVARDALWSLLWAERGLTPKSSVIVRSHVHYHQYCGDASGIRMTTPALQGMGSKFGSRRCSGLVDYGFIMFEACRGDFKWHTITTTLDCHRAKAVKV